MGQSVTCPLEKLHATFTRLRRTHRKALIPFIMGGDPNLQTTKALLLALAEAGADLLEVGIPFSDPLADGPIIQRASSRSLNDGTDAEDVLEIVSAVSRQVAVPLALLSYWNPILQYRNGSRANATSPSAFVRDAQRCGASALIVPDLPPEEAHPLQEAARRVGIATVFLAAPTSPPERLRAIARASEGFIYYVSVTGTTGVRDRLPAEWLHGVRQLKLITTKPICVGFGISTPAQAAAVARVADGVIVGSALIRAIEPVLSNRSVVVKRAVSFVRRLRRAV